MLKRWIAASAASLFLAAGLVGASSPVAAAPAPVGSVADSVNPAPPAMLPDGTKAKNAVRPAGLRDAAATSVAGKKSRPPAPRGLKSGATYNYAGGVQNYANTPRPDGAQAGFKVGNPFIQKPPDGHSLGELAIQGGNTAGSSTDQIVEIGWQKGEAGCADVCLFIYHWVNGGTTCYNGCGFVNYAGTPVVPGASILTWVGTVKNMGWTYSAGNWWASANGSWVGYFPVASIWGSATPAATFTYANRIQGFFELVTDTTLSTKCSDMGNGNFGSATIGAPATTIGSFTLTNGPTPVWSLFTTDAAKWTSVSVNGSVRTLSGGGPGTGGNVGSC